MHFQNSKLSFFPKKCVNWPFGPSFNEYHLNFHIFKTSDKILEKLQLSYNKRSATKVFPIIRDKSKICLFLTDQWYSDACQILTDFDAKYKCSETRQVAHRKSH